MENTIEINFCELPLDTKAATKHLVGELMFKVCPFVLKIRNKMKTVGNQVRNQEELEDKIAKFQYDFLLLTNQIKQWFKIFLEIFKIEFTQRVFLQTSRHFAFEKLYWSVSELSLFSEYADNLCLKGNMADNVLENSMFNSPMYFVNWIDYTFELLGKLAECIYRTDYKDNKHIWKLWIEYIIDLITSLHISIDELLLSAMTLCKYCLEDDQLALKARCQVVLRETKALFSELLEHDITAAVKITPNRLKLPIMPSNVNILIDVLKDVLYKLETNTNSALLAILIQCYVNTVSPVDVLVDHYKKRTISYCSCNFMDNCSKCPITKNFDILNERLMQIGNFAMSCSSDTQRIISLRSCLSILELLDIDLLVAVTTLPDGYHTMLLMNIWKQEFKEIRDIIFLIVDPVAFIERCKLFMQELLLEVKRHDSYGICNFLVVINIGKLVYDFLTIYKKYEPDALIQNAELDRFMENLNRVHEECKIVSKLFTIQGTFDYLHPSFRRHDMSAEIFWRRVQLLYTTVKQINRLFHPNENNEQRLCREINDEQLVKTKNLTHLILNTDKYRNSVSPGNLTKSIFARTTMGKTPSQNTSMWKLMKHLKVKRGQDLSFSTEVSQLFNIEQDQMLPPRPVLPFMNPSDPKAVPQKAMTSPQRNFPFLGKLSERDEEHMEYDVKKSLAHYLDENESLQISAVLNQINDVTTVISTTFSQNKAIASCSKDTTTSK